MKNLIFILSFIFSSLAFSKALKPSDENISKAIKKYQIIVPKNTHVFYSPELKDSARGVTYRFFDKNHQEFFIVGIGSPAFDSMELLGSTLAHEIEIHCHQDFTKMLRSTSLRHSGGVNMMEVEAYSHELKEKKRFNMSKEDLKKSVIIPLQYYIKEEIAVIVSEKFFGKMVYMDYSPEIKDSDYQVMILSSYKYIKNFSAP